MSNVRCFCGSEEFIRVVSIPKARPPIRLVEKKVICHKCKKEYDAKKVNEVLGKV